MKTPSAELRPLIVHAIELRAGGASWEHVGRQVERSPDTCRKWRRDYEEFWNSHYPKAEDKSITEAAGEALLVLRSLLRSQDERIRKDVARLFFVTRLKLRELEQKAAPGIRNVEQEMIDEAWEFSQKEVGHGEDD
jgi:transposase-like protein